MTATSKRNSYMARYKIMNSAVEPYFWAHSMGIANWAVANTIVSRPNVIFAKIKTDSPTSEQWNKQPI